MTGGGSLKTHKVKIQFRYSKQVQYHALSYFSALSGSGAWRTVNRSMNTLTYICPFALETFRGQADLTIIVRIQGEITQFSTFWFLWDRRGKEASLSLSRQDQSRRLENLIALPSPRLQFSSVLWIFMFTFHSCLRLRRMPDSASWLEFMFHLYLASNTQQLLSNRPLTPSSHILQHIMV